MYVIEFSKVAKKQLYKLDVNIQKRIIDTLKRIKIRPYHFIKRKQGTPYYILRIGYYRAILKIQNQKLIIYVIELGPRKKIYF